MRVVFRFFAFFAFFALAFIASSGAAYADIYQRMLLLSGTVTVGPGGSGEIPTRCLDEFAHEPASGLGYKSVAAGLGTTTVQVGTAPPISLQQALDQGVVTLEGFDGRAYTKLRVINPNPTQQVRVVVSSPTVVAPNESYPVEDLQGVYGALSTYEHLKPDPLDKEVMRRLSLAERLEFAQSEANALAARDNSNIWRLRKEHAEKSITQESRDSLKKAMISADAAAMYDQLVKRSIRGGSRDAAFLLLRNMGAAGPVHAIFTGSGDALVTEPFEPLGDVYQKAYTRWTAAIGGRPPVMALAGRGSRSDFDVTNVLLAVAAAGSGGSGGIIVQTPIGFPDPPEGWRPFSIASSTMTDLVTAPNRGGPPGGSSAVSIGGAGGPPQAVLAAAERERGPYKYTETFERGEATAYARQKITIATMAAAIHRFLGRQDAKLESPQTVLQRLKREVERDLNRLYVRLPTLRDAERGGRPGADLEATVDGTRGQWEMAAVDSDTDTGAISTTIVREANTGILQRNRSR